MEQAIDRDIEALRATLAAEQKANKQANTPRLQENATNKSPVKDDAVENIPEKQGMTACSIDDSDAIPRSSDSTTPKHETERLPPLLYIKHKEIVARGVTGLDICEGIARSLDDPSHLKGVQDRTGRLGQRYWCIQTRTEAAREKLLTSLVCVGEQLITFHESNPCGTRTPKVPTLRVTLKDVPMAVSEQAIASAIQKLGVIPTSRVMEELWRGRDGKLTGFTNGNRFFYVERDSFLKLNIPAKIDIQSFVVKVLYNRPSVNKCKACGREGHEPGDEACHFAVQGSNIHTFLGKSSPLSNMHEAKVEYDGLEFRSAEHAYQYNKAIKCRRPEIAASIANDKNPFGAKRLGRQVQTDDAWEIKGVGKRTMAEVLLCKFQQNPHCKKALMETGNITIAESNPYDLLWGTGLTPDQTARTHPDRWPGKNLMGNMLMRLRSKLRAEDEALKHAQEQTGPERVTMTTNKTGECEDKGDKENNEKGRKRTRTNEEDDRRLRPRYPSRRDEDQNMTDNTNQWTSKILHGQHLHCQVNGKMKGKCYASSPDLAELK